MYKIIAASTEIKYNERKKIKKWVTFDENGECSDVAEFKTLEEAKKAFKKYKSDVTELSASGGTYYAVIEYFLVNETDDDFAFLGCSPMTFEVVDKETYDTVKVCETLEEAESYQAENCENSYISFG